jgi:hypothetical protein
MDQPFQTDFRKWMIILFWVVVILFTIVQSKIVHYSSMAYFPLSFLAALVVYRITERKLMFNRWMRFGILSIGTLYAVIPIVLPILAKRIESIKPLFSKDPFALANLDAEVNWTGWEVIPGIMVIIVLILTLFFMKQGRLHRGINLLFVAMAIYVNLTLIFFIARIEGYSQNAAVEFCKSLQGKDCYITTSGYKSYVHYFYGRVTPHNHENHTDKSWLLTGDIDKEVYILTKIHKADELRHYEELEEIGSKNGFVFFKRSPR